jgi:hypothetical protein
LNSNETRIPAAQYLRVSTERQEYSLDLQSAKIAEYAQQHDFVIAHTYTRSYTSPFLSRIWTSFIPFTTWFAVSTMPSERTMRPEPSGAVGASPQNLYIF